MSTNYQNVTKKLSAYSRFTLHIQSQQYFIWTLRPVPGHCLCFLGYWFASFYVTFCSRALALVVAYKSPLALCVLYTGRISLSHSLDHLSFLSPTSLDPRRRAGTKSKESQKNKLPKPPSRGTSTCERRLHFGSDVRDGRHVPARINPRARPALGFGRRRWPTRTSAR